MRRVSLKRTRTSTSLHITQSTESPQEFAATLTWPDSISASVCKAIRISCWSATPVIASAFRVELVSAFALASISKPFINNGTRPLLTLSPNARTFPGFIGNGIIMSPSISIALLESLTFSAGVDIQHFQTQFPAARYEAANAVTTTLRYRRRWASDASRQEVDAGYELRAATRSFGSDYVYNRHAMTAEYKAEIRNNIVSASFHLGTIAGDAPLYERFTLGDTRTLRGWSKFDVAPVGGSRVAHASIEYTFHWIGAFYDTGSVWERGEKSDVKHSVGVSAGGREGLFIALAFPLRAGSVQPLFILGMNF